VLPLSYISRYLSDRYLVSDGCAKPIRALGRTALDDQRGDQDHGHVTRHRGVSLSTSGQPRTGRGVFARPPTGRSAVAVGKLTRRSRHTIHSSRCLIAVVALMTGCGGGHTKGRSSTPIAKVLHLRDYDISAADFRTYIREVLLRPAGQSVCPYVQWLSNGEIIAELRSTNPILPAGGVGTAHQTPNPADEDEAAGIAKDECARITSAAATPG
jgi:hypothetical protein